MINIDVRCELLQIEKSFNKCVFAGILAFLVLFKIETHTLAF